MSYAPEIAQAMLVRQQAQALVDARKIVVQGATEIVNDAIEQLSDRGLDLPASDRARLVSNLLTVICGDANVQPTLPIHSSGEMDNDQFEKILQLLEDIRKNTNKTS